MVYWESGLVLNALLLALLLAGGGLLRMLPGLRPLGIPGAILGGCLGLLLGPEVLGLLPLQLPSLESVVYHGLALVFIAVALQSPLPAAPASDAGEGSASGRWGGGALSLALAFPVFLCIQAILGLLCVLALGVHPGFAMLLALGFEQGPGQALAMGSSWEGSGLKDGAQVGLIMASIGFGWSILAGVPLALWGRRRGLQSDLSAYPAPPPSAEEARLAAGEIEESGVLDALSRQVAAIAAAYLLTWLFVSQLAGLFLGAGMKGLSDTAWGFHFIFGALFAMLVRKALARLPARLSAGSPLDDRLLSRLAGFTVDVTTCASIAAVDVGVLSENLGPILLITTVGGSVTLLATVWLSSRAFPRAPFEHCLLMFGTVTGTLPTGLSLLRTIDPEMRTPASRNAVTGAAISIPFVAVVLMVLMPLAINPWPQGGYPAAGWVAIAAFSAYLVVLILGWRYFGPLRFDHPLRLWATPPQKDPASP